MPLIARRVDSEAVIDFVRHHALSWLGPDSTTDSSFPESGIVVRGLTRDTFLDDDTVNDSLLIICAHP
jgi:hypothetical protein